VHTQIPPLLSVSPIKFKAGLFVVVANLALVLIIVFMAEVVCGVIIGRIYKRPGKMDTPEFVSQRPKPFQAVDDFALVLASQFEGRCPLPRIVLKPNGFPAFERRNQSCPGFSWKGGLRRTTNQPYLHRNTIFFFGGSTIFGSGSSDEYTIPSVFQRLVNKYMPNTYSVVNHGFTTVIAKQQLAELKQQKLNGGDVVVFYDGANDIWQGVVYEQPGGTILGYNDSNRIRMAINKLKFWLARNSNVYRILMYFRDREGALNRGPCEQTADAVINRNAENSFLRYASVIKEARDYVVGHGGQFWHFLQPSLFSRSSPFSDYEMSLINDRPSEMIPCKTYDDAFQKGYMYFASKYRERRSLGNDFTNLLDPIKDNREYFYDWTHVSSAANKKIAATMFDVVFPSERPIDGHQPGKWRGTP